VLDALAKRVRLPLWAFFGGAEQALVTDVTIPIASIAEAGRAAAERAAEGFGRLKVKVGGARAGDDLARLLAVREAAPDAALMLDGNGGLHAEAALDLLADLRARGVTPILFEQPVPGEDLAGLAEVARRGGVPVAADESVATAADVLRVAALGAARVVNIKLMKSGVAEALAIAAAARAAAAMARASATPDFISLMFTTRAAPSAATRSTSAAVATLSSAATGTPPRRATSASPARSSPGNGCSNRIGVTPRARRSASRSSAASAWSPPLPSSISAASGAASRTASSRARSSTALAPPTFTLSRPEPLGGPLRRRAPRLGDSRRWGWSRR